MGLPNGIYSNIYQNASNLYNSLPSVKRRKKLRKNLGMGENESFGMQLPNDFTPNPEADALYDENDSDLIFDDELLDEETDVVKEKSGFSKFMGKTGDFLKKNGQTIGAVSDAANNMLFSAFGQKQGMDGPNGQVTSAIDSAYDQASDEVMKVNPLVGGIMKTAGLVGNIINKAGGGTDGMTTADGILNSAPMTMLTLGLNGFLGQESNTITKDQQAFAQVGSSFGGSNALVDQSLNFSGKKYGAVSLGAMRDANGLINNARMQQSMISDIADMSSTAFNLQAGMSAINGNARGFQMQGGYQQNAVHVGRHGLSFKTIDSAKNIVNKYKEGGKEKDPFEYYLSTLPSNQRTSDNYRIRDYWELNGRPKDFEEAKAKEMFTLEDDGYWHAHTVQYNEATDEYEFMKSPKHDTIHFEEEWYNSDDPEAVKFRNEWELIKTKPYWKYVRRSPKVVESHKEGGILTEITLDSIPKEYFESFYIKEITIDDILPEFKEGGEIQLFKEGGKENDPIKYARERFPILSNYSVNLQQDDNFNPGWNIEYMNAKNETLPYYNHYSKSLDNKGQSTIIYNSNVDNEDIALDWLTHGLRENDTNWQEYLKQLSEDSEWKSQINDELFGKYLQDNKIDNFDMLSESLQNIIKHDFDSYENEEAYNSVIDGLIRGLFTDKESYGPKDLKEKLRQSPIWQEMEQYIQQGNPEKFQKGGSFNVIPEGALHAHKHHMENDENITKKGIPVVDNQGEQQAEIEREEIIMRLEVTEQLERLSKIYYSQESSQRMKDEAALEAGQLLTQEILYNTQDRTGLLNKIN